MRRTTDSFARIARRIAIPALALPLAASGTAAAHGGGSYGGGMMGDGGWGLFGGTMGLWGLLWMGLLLGVPIYLVYAFARRDSNRTDSRPLSVLRERYARGELSDEEFERRRAQLERNG